MSVELPPLPNKEKLHTVLPDDYRYGHIYGYTADQMREYGRACERAAYERAEAQLRAVSTGFDAAGGDVAAASASFCAAVIRALLDEMERLRQKLRGADAAERSINEALNSGDGVYRP